MEILLNSGNLLPHDFQRKIGKVTDKIKTCIQRKNTIWIMGNGGSSSTADHFETDLSFVRLGRDIDFVSAQSLTSNSALVTAIANDIGFEEIFRHQLLRKSREGDLIFIISASGNSQNLINAVNYATENNLESLALLGFDGGKLLSLVDDYILVKSEIGCYGPVEDIHLALCHSIALELKKRL